MNNKDTDLHCRKTIANLKNLKFFAIGAVLFAMSEISLEFLNCRDCVGCDFRLRRNEAICVLSRIDPFLVWNGSLKHFGFRSYNKHDTGESAEDRLKLPVNAYPPWEYTLMFPFTILTESQAWNLVRYLMLVASACCMVFGFWYGRMLTGRVDVSLLCAAATTFSGIAVGREFATGNYGVFLALSLFFLALCLRQGFDIAGGAALAFLMIKPQIGVLILLPLLIGNRFKVILLAGAFCLIAAIPPSLLLKECPISLVMQIPKYGSDVAHGSMLCPGPIFDLICEYSGQFPLVATNAGLGAIIAFLLSWKLRKSPDWFIKLSPSILMSTAWTYSSLHDRWVYSIPLIILTIASFSCVRSEIQITSIAAIVGLSSSAMLVFHSGYGGTWWDSVGLTLCTTPFSRQLLTGIVSVTSAVGLFCACFVFWSLASEKNGDLRRETGLIGKWANESSNEYDSQ